MCQGGDVSPFRSRAWGCEGVAGGEWERSKE